MKTALKSIGVFVIIVITIIALLFGGNALGLWSYSVFAPKRENARREVFENTQSFVEGKRQSLTKYYNEFRKADAVEKEVLRMLILQDFANFDINKLNATQRGWYNEITR